MNKKLIPIMKPILFIFSIVFFVFFAVMPQYTGMYFGRIHQRYTRLSTLDSPKIVLVGDSNVAFGINSQMLEDEFNIPVVNMGQHGGLMTFHTDMIRSQISEGDIIILASAEFPGHDGINNYVLAWSHIENDVRLLKELRIQDYAGMIKAFPTYLKKTLNLFASHTGNIFSDGYSVNKYGDISNKRDCNIMKNGYQENSGYNPNSMDDGWCQYLNNYSDFVTSKGASFYLAAPPIIAVEDNLKTDYSITKKNLSEKLNFPVISDFQDYLYPIDYFYDTNFHLNDYGKNIHTEQLIKDLRVIHII